MKKILSLLLCAVMLIALMPAAYAQTDTEQAAITETEDEAPPEENAQDEAVADACEDELLTEDSSDEQYEAINYSGTCGKSAEWTLDEDGVLHIFGEGRMDSYGYSSDYMVMGDASVRAPWYKYRNDIYKAIIDGGITNVGGAAFAECRNISEIVLGDSVEAIYMCAFVGCNPNVLRVGSGIKRIEEMAFINSGTISELYISDVASWMKAANPELDGGLIADEMCPNTYNTTLYVNDEKVSVLTIPEGITRIAAHQFWGIKLDGVILSESVKSIGDSAFTESGLKSIYIPAGIGEYGLNNGCLPAQSLKTVFFGGSEEEWKNLDLNAVPKGVTVHFNSSYGEHTAEVLEAIEPSCSAAGLTEGSRCKVCGEILLEQETIEKTEHMLGDSYVVSEASCIDEGIVAAACEVCGEEVVIETLPRTEHILGDSYYAADATCVEEGILAAVCEFCGEEFWLDIIPPKAHTPDNGTVIIKPTFDSEGEIIYRCIECGGVLYTESIPTLNEDNTLILKLSDAAPARNGAFKVNISIENNPGVSGMTFRLMYDSAVMELVTVEPITSVPGMWSISKNNIGWLNNKDYTKNGVVASAVFRLKESTAVNGAEIGVDPNWGSILNSSYDNLGLIVENAHVTSVDRVAGDVNGDNEVTIKDAMMLLKCVTGEKVSISEDISDVNGDGKTNMKDAVSLLKRVTGEDMVIF